MLKKITLYAFLCITSLLTLNAQEIRVVRFEQEQGGILTQPPKDVNARECAMIRVMTTCTDISFDETFCAPRQLKTSEIDIFLPPNSRWLTVRRKNYKVLDYHFPAEIESKRVYILELEYTGEQAPESPTDNFLRLSVTPPEAQVTVDGTVVYTQNGTYSSLLPIGKHTYEISCAPLYHPMSGEFTITPDSTTALNLQLSPHFGYITVTSSPESGAAVHINSVRKGETPYTSDKLVSGKYTILVSKDMYNNATTEVVVTDGQTPTVNMEMAPNFAEPTLVCSDPEAEIWINGVKKGVGRWSGRIAAGVYKFTTKKDFHEEVEKSYTIKAGDNSTITLDQPIPIYGRMSVNSTPFDATIYVDGNKVGLTPKLLNNILIGDHDVKIEKQGFISVTQSVKVEKGKTSDVTVQLSKGQEVIFESDPDGATIYIDGEIAGTTPLTATLPYGKHNVTAEKDGYTTETTITAKEDGEKTWNFDLRKKAQVAENTDINVTDNKKESRPWNTFFTVNFSYSTLPQFAYGFKVGQVQICGWYFGCLTNFNFKGAFHPLNNNTTYNLTGSTSTSRLSFTGGLVIRPIDFFSIIIGAGFGYRSLNVQTSDGNVWYSYKPRTFMGVDAAFGLMFHHNRVIGSLEAVTTQFKTLELSLGIGFYITQSNKNK